MQEKRRAPKSSRTIRIAVPEPLAAEIRRVATVARRAVQSVADAVLDDRFSDLKPEGISRRWLTSLEEELGQSRLPVSDNAAEAEEPQ